MVNHSTIFLRTGQAIKEWIKIEPEAYRYMQQREDLWVFVRKNPEWYRYLSREPASIKEMEVYAKTFYGKTIPQRLEKTQQNVQMIRLLMEMAGAWND